MKEIRTRLNPENKKSTNENYIFGNLDGVVDYHNIKNYKIKGVSIEEHINTRDNEIKALNARLDALEQTLQDNKHELLSKIHEIITSKVV